MFKSIEDPKNIKQAYKEFQNVTKDYDNKQKSDLSLKVLITICRSLDKVEWKNGIDVGDLVSLTAQLCDVLSDLTEVEYKKYVAVMCSIHRCIVNKKCTITSSLLLLRYVFENPKIKLQSSLHSNYFILLADMLQGFDKTVFTSSVSKLVAKVITSYFAIVDSLIIDNLSWIVRKCDSILSNADPKSLQVIYQNLFTALLQNDRIVKNMSNITDHHALFKKLLQIIGLVYDNIIKCGYKTPETINLFFKLCLHLFQRNNIFYKTISDIQSVMPVFSTPVDKLQPNSCKLIAEFIKNLYSLRDSKKFADLEEICITFRRILSTSLSKWSLVSEEIWRANVSTDVQTNILQLLNLIIKVLSKSQLQSIQCSKCNTKSAIHDSLFLTKFAGTFCTKSSKAKMNIKYLFPYVQEILIEQTQNVNTLRINGCPNWKQLWKEIENRHHNDCITLFSCKAHEHSKAMFDIYFINVFEVLTWESDYEDLNYLSKAFYNMAVCLADLQLYHTALVSCYVSWILSSLSKSEKTSDIVPQSQLVIQVKSKLLSQSSTQQSNDILQGKTNDEMQMMSIWSACKYFLSIKENQVFYKIFSSVKFDKLLLCELKCFLQTWPSTNSIAGICASLKELCIMCSATHKPSEKSPDHIGILDTNSIMVSCGQAVTLLLKHSVKVTNCKITDMIHTTAKVLEHHVKFVTDAKEKGSKLSDDANITLLKLYWANCLFACSVCRMYETRKLGAQHPLEESAPPSTAPHHEPLHPDDACDVTPAHQYLTLRVEDETMESVYRAVQVWRDAVQTMESDCYKTMEESDQQYMWSCCDIIEFCSQVCLLHNIEHSILAADISYTLSQIVDHHVCIMRSAGVILEHATSKVPELQDMIERTNSLVYAILLRNDEKPQDSELLDACFEYLLSLSMYYCKVKQVHVGGVILSSVSNRILSVYQGEDKDSEKLIYARVLKAHSHFIAHCQHKEKRENMFGILSCHVNSNIDCGDVVKAYEHNRGRAGVLSQRMWLESGASAGAVALSLGLVRRARALLRAPLSASQRLLLPRRAAHLLTLLAQADLMAERHNDCAVKIDGIKYILNEQNTQKTKKSTTSKKTNVIMEKPKSKSENEVHKNFEMILDVPVEENNYGISVGGSPIFRPTPFVLPTFVDHVRSCQCFRCNSVALFIVYINFIKLHSQLHFRNGESKIAESFYNGGLKLIEYLYQKLEHVKENFNDSFINNFNLQVFHKYKYNEMLTAKCYFINDAVIFHITEDEMDLAKELNDQTVNIIDKHLSHDYFLYQATQELAIFLLQSKVFKKNEATMSQLDIMDDLQNEISSKLIITPEKEKHLNIVTPFNNRAPAVNRINRNTAKRSPALREIDNFVRPAIKLNLDDADDDTKDVKTVKNVPSEPITPAPKIKTARSLLTSNTPMQTNRSTVKDKVQNIIKSEESPALAVVFNNKAGPKVYANKAARQAMKFTITPDNLIVEPHVPESQNVAKTNKIASKENNVRPLRNKTTATKTTVEKSAATSSSAVKLAGAQKKEVKPVERRVSARKKV